MNEEALAHWGLALTKTKTLIQGDGKVANPDVCYLVLARNENDEV